MQKPLVEQVHYAVTVALGWIEEAGADFRARPEELPTLAAEHDMLSAKFDAIAGDLKQLQERIARLLVRTDRVQDAGRDEGRHQDGAA